MTGVQGNLFVIPAGTIRVHQHENNSQSESHLVQNKTHFTKQCEKVLELLKSGKRLTVINAMNDYKVMSLPRRILDLKGAGITIQSRFIPGTRIKEYWI